MMQNKIKKLLTKGVMGVCILVMCFGIIQIPFVAAGYIVEHPIEVIVDFLGDFLGIDIDSSSSIYELADVYYKSNKSIKKTIDASVKKYEKGSKGVTTTNVAIPFLIYKYEKINQGDCDAVAAWLQEFANAGLSEDDYIDFITNESFFQNKKKALKYDKEFISSFFGVTVNDVGDAVVIPGSSITGNMIAEKAITKIGSRYWWGAPGGGFGDKQNLDDPNAKYFDCSGFVACSHRQSGVKIGRTTAAGYAESGREIHYDLLQAGDVITFSHD